MKHIILLFIFLFLFFSVSAGNRDNIVVSNDEDGFLLVENSLPRVSILIERQAYDGVKEVAVDLQNDFEMVCGHKPILSSKLKSGKNIVLIATLGNSRLLDRLTAEGKFDSSDLKDKREKYLMFTIRSPFKGIEEALVIAGSDKRGTIYGIYELSRQIGVSPWYYWADVPVVYRDNIKIKRGQYTDGEPAVRYRGIFLNDEAPALTGWVKERFGGYNSRFYEKVFELVLRLRGNFMWPAMWNAAFYDDDSLNSPLADKYGIIIGTSHHEPMARSQQEWKRYGSGDWNYENNKAALDSFWREGIRRMRSTEDVVTIGMRGDGDEPMSQDSNIDLLERIVDDQREIIAIETGSKPESTPQVWALYKEVQDYYDKGMRVPDDVTLLISDDNWGNVRKLPDMDATPRKGGYGMYYHFDYVGGPRNYKWINVSQIQRIWEQMNLCYEYGVDRIWVVNVGDLKPMEYPITFFLDMAWNPGRFHADNLFGHTVDFCNGIFGEQYASQCARLINTYCKYSRRVTPELLDQTTYSLENYNEFERVCRDFWQLDMEATTLYHQLPNELHDTYYQLVLFPIQAFSNLYSMYYAVAMNHKMSSENNPECNRWASLVKILYEKDSVLCDYYNHKLSDGKWNHFMDQTHIGYRYWQQPPRNVMPEVKVIGQTGNDEEPTFDMANPLGFRCLEPKTDVRHFDSGVVFSESDGYVSIEAEHYHSAVAAEGNKWVVVPDLGKTLSGVMLLPAARKSSEESPSAAGDVDFLEYCIDFKSTGEFDFCLYFSPTLNFNSNCGLRYAISIDGGKEQFVNINGTYDIKQMEKWQAESINKTTTSHVIISPGIHTLKIRFLDPGLVLQKITIDTGSLLPSYLGPEESSFCLRSF